MIQKTILVKAAAAVIGTAVIAGAVAAVNHMLKPKENSYRSILLYEIEGTAKVERQGAGTINGVENLHLESGDELTVEAESFTRLRLDDDKYVMVEEDSALSIEAAGSREDSRTSIHLTKGTIINEIQNPLSAGSMYEVTTPNSVMAVRGTIFRVEIYYDENGELCTRVSVLDGEVASRLIYPDGTMDEEVVTSHGKEVIIHSNADLTEYLGESREIDYDSLPLGSLYTIRDLMDQGSFVEGITREELAELIRRMEGSGEEDKEAPDDESRAPEENREGESSRPDDSTDGPETEDGNEAQNAPAGETQRESRPGRTEEGGNLPETTREAESQSLQPQEAETTARPSETQPTASGNTGRSTGRRHGSSGGSGGSGNSGGSLWQRPTESSTEAPTESSTEAPTQSSTEAPTESSTEASTEAPTEPAEYTVTFMYNGSVFGTQQVKAGQCAQKPRLNPSSTGSWDFNFDSPITADTAILWKN